MGATVFSITCREAAEGAAADVVVDGIRTAGDSWTLIDDGHAHEVLVNVAHRQ